MADGIMTQAEESRLRDRLELDSSGTDRLMLDAKLAAIAFGGTFTGASTQLYKTGNYRLATPKGSHPTFPRSAAWERRNPVRVLPI